MKKFLSTLIGKLVVGIGSVCIVAAVVIAVIMVTKNDDYHSAKGDDVSGIAAIIDGKKDDYRTIKVDGVTGIVTITDGKNTVNNAYEGMNLKSGDKVMVEVNSNMTLLLDMDKYVFADAGTKFWLEATGNSEEGKTRTKIHLEEGSVLCRLDSKLGKDESYDIETPNSVMSVRGTVFRAAIYQDEEGENYTEVDVLEGSVNVDLQMESGEKLDENDLVESGRRALVHSNPEISEFVVSDGEITYENYTPEMGTFILDTIDSGRELDVEESILKHVTGLETHPETEKIVKAPTCSTEGTKEILCPTCDMVVRIEAVDKLPHTEGEWMLSSESTCIEKGKEELHCSVCSEVMETRELELVGHDYGDWTIEKEATCKEEGVEKRVCSICNKEETKSIAKVEHSYGDWVVETAATCEADGQEVHICSVCSSKESNAISATGHQYSDWTVATYATCTATGSQERICKLCSNKETSTIAATEHNLTHVSHEVESMDSDGNMYIRVGMHCRNDECSYLSYSTMKATKIEENDTIFYYCTCGLEVVN